MGEDIISSMLGGSSHDHHSSRGRWARTGLQSRSRQVRSLNAVR